MNCIFLRRGYPEINEAPDYSDNFADNDWATIIKVCQAGLAPDSWKDDGTSYKDMNIGVDTYRIVIVGKMHDEYEDGKKAPLTFQIYNCLANASMNSSNTNVGGWENSELRTTTLPERLAQFPEEVQAAIRPVKKLTSAGNLSTNIVVTYDKLFVPSEVEVFGHNNNSVAGEGTRYEYYANGGSTVKTVGGYAATWHERSPSKSSAAIFCCVGTTGAATTGNASSRRGLSVMFCF